MGRDARQTPVSSGRRIVPVMGFRRARQRPSGRSRVAALAAWAAPVGLALVVSALPLFAPAAGAIVGDPEADVELVGSVEEAPPGGGITTGDSMEYVLTVRNLGPSEVPARRLLVVLYVDHSDESEPWPMEVASFDAPEFRPPRGGSCGIGRRDLIQCTNTATLGSGEEIQMRIGHRHPEAVAGALTFVAEVDFSQGPVSDPVAGNNGFRGPTYGFLNPPTTTSTSTTSTTTTSSTESTTTSVSSSSSTTSSSTMSTTTTTAPTSTTTSTTMPSSSTTSIAGLAGPASLPSTVAVVAGAEGSATETSVDDQQALGPTASEQGGGPPYVLLGALAALVMVAGGLGLAAYAHLNRTPPLVDIRSFD